MNNTINTKNIMKMKENNITYNLPRVAKFEKVSREQFKKDMLNNNIILDNIDDIYDKIKLPTRATAMSAGHDFFAPFKLSLKAHDSIIIPTGIRCKMDDGWVLNIYPRSGQGFKYGFRLYNTVGIIDADYYKTKIVDVRYAGALERFDNILCYKTNCNQINVFNINNLCDKIVMGEKLNYAF